MPSWDGTFSMGAVSGALCGWLCLSFGLPLGWHLPTVSIVLMGVMGLANTQYLQDGIPRACVGTGPFRGAVVSGPRTLPLSKSVTSQERRLALEPVIILLGIVIFATALGEGTANDWLALLLVDTRRAPAALGALTYGGVCFTNGILPCCRPPPSYTHPATHPRPPPADPPPRPAHFSLP